jgi:hypothetical protein
LGPQEWEKGLMPHPSKGIVAKYTILFFTVPVKKKKKAASTLTKNHFGSLLTPFSRVLF